jgi:hypothetical protein
MRVAVACMTCGPLWTCNSHLQLTMTVVAAALLLVLLLVHTLVLLLQRRSGSVGGPTESVCAQLMLPHYSHRPAPTLTRGTGLTACGMRALRH